MLAQIAQNCHHYMKIQFWEILGFPVSDIIRQKCPKNCRKAGRRLGKPAGGGEGAAALPPFSQRDMKRGTFDLPSDFSFFERCLTEIFMNHGGISAISHFVTSFTQAQATETRYGIIIWDWISDIKRIISCNFFSFWINKSNFENKIFILIFSLIKNVIVRWKTFYFHKIIIYGIVSFLENMWIEFKDNDMLYWGINYEIIRWASSWSSLILILSKLSVLTQIHKGRSGEKKNCAKGFVIAVALEKQGF